MSGENKYLTFDEIKENYRNNIDTPFVIFVDKNNLTYTESGTIEWVTKYPEKFATFEKLFVRGIFENEKFEGFLYNYRKRNLLLPHTNFTDDKRAYFPIPTNDFFITFKSMYKSNTKPNDDEQVEKAVSEKIKTLSEKTRSKTGQKFSLQVPNARITTPREKVKNGKKRKIMTMGGKKHYKSRTKKHYKSITKKQYKYSHCN